LLSIGLVAATTEVGDVDGWAPWGVLAAGLAAATTEVEDVDDGPPGGVLVAGPAVATTDVDDVNGGPLEGSWRLVWQRPPPKLKTSVTGPPGGAGGKSGNDHHQS
jgi:hypothetical protein